MLTAITRDDIMDMVDYAKVRKERRRNITKMKRDRRVALGPDATFYFESYDTMWHQIHEMLYIERGGEEQIIDELAAYNPLIPKGRELVATLMFEIDEPERRERFLASLGGVEEKVCLSVGEEVIRAEAELDVDRTSVDGKASSVHFLHFPFSDECVALFCDPSVKVILAIEHEKYPHMTLLSETVRVALQGDFSYK
ncbi:MAG: hypothetical protein CMF67_11275 [Magnetovibrio sp.]|nr:hypothetical protein [Magnetovibrio sp.]|tara:strand:+ start:167 stop:757 length:591 start_codon:yes stop_codon:yes gene_type:complete